MSIYIGKTKIASSVNVNTGYPYLNNTGDGSKYLANDGNYYVINNFGIDDANTTSKTTFSSEKIDNKINTIIKNLVLPTQNDAPTIWQKTYLNVKAGDVLEMVTSEDFIMDKLIVQAFKSVSGTMGVTEIIKKFSNSEQGSFYYNENNVEFINTDDGKAKIKDAYVITNSLRTDGLYESNIINKSDYIDFNSITVEERL
jgi:hypothetical protein